MHPSYQVWFSSRSGVAFLNATPFWGWMPRLDARAESWVARVLPWDGALPAPPRLKAVLRKVWWDNFTKEDNVRRVLQLVYHHG
jgi:hypothetical protein